jgi:hypothetical protein
VTTPGRRLLELSPAERVELHRQCWPDELLAFQEAGGQVLARVLEGSAGIRLTAVDERGTMRVHLESMEPAERTSLDLTTPEPDEDGRPKRKSLDLQALLMPVALRSDSTWVINQLPANAPVEQSSTDALVCALLLAPAMSDLAGILRLRAGHGPQTDEGRAGLLLRCRQAHDALGLRSDLVDPLLEPTLNREQVLAARRALILSWANHPEDLGARLMALLCAQLAQAYYSKARKDGTVQEARVINTRTRPLLDATLREWGRLVDYLGEGLSVADAQPIEVPDAALPSTPPEPVLERIEVLREWWQLYDARHAAQRPGDCGLGGLVPPRWDYTNPHDERNGAQLGDSDLYRSALPSELVAQIERLWGSTVLPRVPSIVITEPRPFIRFRNLLQPAIDVWDDLATNCWSLCFANWGYPLDQMEERHAKLRRELDRLNAPVDVAMYRELCEAGRGHDWLFAPRGVTVTFAISLEEGVPTVSTGDDRPSASETAATFLALRQVLDAHRRRWLDVHLDLMLDAIWRADLGNAARCYWKRFRGKGSPPTVKQALPDVLDAAQRWLNADFGALGRLTALQGPITQSPTATSRQLPSDLTSIRRDVATVLRTATRDSTREPREVSYRIDEVVSHVDQILAYWQASGAAPPRAAVFGSGYAFIFDEFFGCDLEHGYHLLLEATRERLERAGHPAAADLTATSTRR